MKNKKLTVITCMVTLLPVLAGFLMWNQLPDEMAVHFNFAGDPDTFVNKWTGVLLIPGILLVLQLICLAASEKGTSSIHSKWAETIVVWIVPAASLIVSGLLYAFNSGIHVNIATWVVTIISILFLVLCNLMPKTSMNSFFGAKVPWAYKSEAAWKLTQRINGWGMVLGSIGALLLAWTGHVEAAIWMILGAMAVSLLYSWAACRKLSSSN